MYVKISMFIICAEAIVHLLLYNLHDCTFKWNNSFKEDQEKVPQKTIWDKSNGRSWH